MSLAAAPERMHPVAADLTVKLLQSLLVARHIKVCKVASHHLAEPSADHGDRFVASA
jgi:hypothetical protein